MAGIRIQLNKDLETKFREVAMRKFGYGRGSLTKAAAEAIEAWLKPMLLEIRFEGDPVAAIDGLLSDVDLDSVELQHLAPKVWAAKASQNVSG